HLTVLMVPRPFAMLQSVLVHSSSFRLAVRVVGDIRTVVVTIQHLVRIMQGPVRVETLDRVVIVSAGQRPGRMLFSVAELLDELVGAVRCVHRQPWFTLGIVIDK